MKAIFGLVQPKSGRVMVSGRPISGLRPSQVARLGVGYVPQRANVFPSLTVAENLEIGLSAAPHKSLPRRLEAMYGLFPASRSAAARQLAQCREASGRWSRSRAR